MSPMDVERMALWWGPGILVLIIFGYGFLRLAHYWIEKSMEVKRQQTESAYGIARQYIEQFLGAQTSQADALSRLANCVEHRESVESFEHQEILIALKAMHRDMDTLDCRRNEPSCVFRSAPGAVHVRATPHPAGLARLGDGEGHRPPPGAPAEPEGAAASEARGLLDGGPTAERPSLSPALRRTLIDSSSSNANMGNAQRGVR